MRKIITFIMCVVALIGTTKVQAQQIDGSFEAWEDCTVWDGLLNGGDFTIVGKQPKGWTASNVSQMGMTKEFVTIDAGRENNGSAPKITNEFVGIPGFMGANAPAFITLGKMWVFPDVAGMMAAMQPDEYPGAKDMSDGGVTGGVKFANRPDSITVYYKRALGTENAKETAKVLVYLWKGTFKSKVIVEHAMSDDGKTFLEPVYKDTIDQDRAILGKEGVIMSEGGDGVLIGKAEYAIEGSQEDWARLSIPINYLTGDVPEKMNIVFSGCNFWVRADIGAGNTLWVDDAALIYNAQLKDITIGGNSITGFKSGVYNYSLSLADASKEIKALAWGKDAEISIVEKENTGSKIVKEVTVTDNATNDITKTYTYTLTFQGEQSVITLPEGAAHEYIYGDGANLVFSSNNPSEINYEISDESIVTYDKEAKKFKMVGVGNVSIVAKQEASANYASAVSEPFNVTVSRAKLTISFKEGTAWCRRGQRLMWYSNKEDRLKNNSGDAEFSVAGLKNDDDLNAALDGRHLSVDASMQKDEVVGEYRTATLEISGEGENTTAHYEVEFLSDQKMLIKKTLVKVSAEYAGKSLRAAVGSSAKEVIIPEGEDVSCIRLYYSGLLTNENESVFGQNIPVLQCPGITKSSPVGTTSAMTVTFPDANLLANHEFVSDIPSDGVVKTATAPNFSVVEKDLTAIYGSKVKLTVTKDEGVEHNVNRTFNSTNIDDDKVTVTMIKAGVERLIVYVKAKDTFAGKEQIVNINIGKAPFMVKAKNMTLPQGDNAPESFELEYAGFVNGDDSAKVFTVEPSAVLEKEIPTDVKVGDTFAIVVNPGESANYDLTSVNGILTITTPTGINQDVLSNIRIYSTDGNIYIVNNEARETVRVYTIQGVKVYEGIDNVISSNLQRGTMYMVQVGTGLAKVIVK